MFYLKQWTGTDRQLHEFRRVADKIVTHRIFPDATGYERDLYRIDGLPDHLCQVVESQFMKMVDTDAHAALQRIIQADPRESATTFSRYERHSLTTFMFCSIHCLMQGYLFTERQGDIETMKSRLNAAFGNIRDEQRLDPTSQFVHAFIGSRTYDEVSSRAFARLVMRYQSWEDIADADAREIESVLAGVTYAEDKSVNLVHALRKIRACAGMIDLEFLADLPVEMGLLWLENIYGVGRKIAAATLNFSTLRKRAFVVDTHVLRVVRRFGIVAAQADRVAVYDAIMASAPAFDADDLYELHWQLKYLGQRICTHVNAQCSFCVLSDICLRRLEKRLEPANDATRRIAAHRASSAEIPVSVRRVASLASNVKA